MSTYEAYPWPDIQGSPAHDPWRAWVEWALRSLLRLAAIQNPNEVFGDDFDFDAGEDDGHSIPYDGGGGGPDAGGGGSEPPQAEPYGVWAVIDPPQTPGTIDVQALATTSTLVPGMVLRNVYVPTQFGTPLENDVGTVRKLPDATNVFIPSCRRPRAASSVTQMGSGDERADPLSQTWNAASPTGVSVGGSVTYQSNTTFNEADATPDIIARYGNHEWDEFGQITYSIGETEVNTGDLPALCAFPASATVGSTGETEVADTSTWTRTSPAVTGNTLTLTKLYRMAYNHAGDRIVYAYYRNEVYDKYGIRSVSAETRVSIDATEACP